MRSEIIYQLNNDEDYYYLIDQEWTLENVPYEYVLYRGIINVFQNIDNGSELANKYLSIFNLIDYSYEFFLLERQFQTSTLGDLYNIFESKSRFKSISDEIYEKECLINSLNDALLSNNKVLKEKEKEIADKNKKITELENEVELLREEVNSMIFSRSWKITKPIRYVKNKIKKSK